MNPEPASPAATFRVAFLGFSDFERTSLASYFRLVIDRDPRYELVYTLTDADFLVADADHAPSVQLVVVTERLAETVFIGSQAPPGAAGSMHRPIDALHVMRALDVMAHLEVEKKAPAVRAIPAPHTPPPARPAATRTHAAAAPAAAAPASDVIVESMLRMPAPWALPASPPAEPASRVAPAVTPPAPLLPTKRRSPERSTLAHPQRPPRPSLPVAGSAPAAAFVGPPPPLRALLVDDSAIALRFLASRLEPWCVRCDSVTTSSAALEQLAKRAYDFIFIDVELGLASDLDGLALCRTIKRSELAFNATVVMVSAHHSEIDRARGSLAGCDSYLGKPLKEADLTVLLRRHGLVPPQPAAESAGARVTG